MARAPAPGGRPERLRVRIVGTVQGVGFRPFVFRLARELGLAGWVRNDGDGVTVEVDGPHAALLAFLERLRRDKPPAAWIHALDARFLPAAGFPDFEIHPSPENTGRRAWILPDLAVCDDCRAELFDAADRRHRYPFLNCTNCGPRFTIVEDLPYDRAATSMHAFTMCPACAAEYGDPRDRRFHAQPTACPRCGPRAELLDARGTRVANGAAAVDEAVRRVGRGGILAVKGLGGYHLVVDAGDDAAVTELRRRKRRSHKPFAVMYPDLATLRSHVELPSFAEPLLTSAQAPILLLRATARASAEIAPSVAPGSPYLGVFLPYTPLHALLVDGVGRPVVATSGNLSDEPIQHRDDAARAELGALADAFLVHDRPIVRPADDSVLQIVERPRPKPQLLRRARGYTPLPILAPRPLPPLLAVGGQMNVAFALARDHEIILSQHLGDLDGHDAREAYRRTLDDFLRLYGVAPTAVAHDLHPDYATTALAELLGLPRIGIQHHHAHLAACLLEHEVDGEALGLTWDGTGYGLDGTVWGGEFLLGDAAASRRVATLTAFRLPGGERAVREPWRTALALLWEAYGADAPRDLPPFRDAAGAPRAAAAPVLRMAARGVNAPVTTSMGRLYDGVAAILGLADVNTHQAQAAQALEYAAWRHRGPVVALPLPVTDGDPLRLDVPVLVRALVDRRHAGESVPALAAAFHHALVEASRDVVARVGAPRVALAGGVFCNRYLTETLTERLEGDGVEVLFHTQLPPTDGSLAAGQLWAAAQRM